MKKVRLFLWLDDDLREWIDEKAKAESRSRNNMTVTLLKKCRDMEKKTKS